MLASIFSFHLILSGKSVTAFVLEGLVRCVVLFVVVVIVVVVAVLSLLSIA